MKIYIPYGRHKIFKSDFEAVKKILHSDYLTQGPTVFEFEKKFKLKVKSKYSIAMNSATSALHAACVALEIKKNDIVWISSITFVASANCALHCKAKVDFVDIDLNTFNICVDSLKKKLENTIKDKRPKLLIVVHLGGLPCDMAKIYKLSKKYNFKIIEDASHAIGSKINKLSIGSCKYSDLTVFSLHPVKIITSGEGGIITTNKKSLNDKLKILREHGIEKDHKKIKGTIDGPWFYQQQDLGYNFRMSDLHASLGISQLKKLDKFVDIRNKIAKKYYQELKNLPIIFQDLRNNYFSSYHLFIIRVSDKIHLELFNYLRKKKILVNLHYIPVYRHIYYRSIKKFSLKNFKNSEIYYRTAISLPIFVGLKEKDQLFVINTIKYFFNKNKLN